jgi:hypothetical protein
MDLWELPFEFLKMRDTYNDLLTSYPLKSTTDVIITAEILKDFTVYSDTNLKVFSIEKGTSLQTDCD